MTEPTRANEYHVPDTAPRPAARDFAARQASEVGSFCHSCHAAILWTTTANGKPIPLSVASIRTDGEGTRWALSHFADCPNAAGHRKADLATPATTRATSPTPKPAIGSTTQTVNLLDLADYLNRYGLRIQSTRANKEPEKPKPNEYVPLVIEAIAIRAIRGDPCEAQPASTRNDGR